MRRVLSGILVLAAVAFCAWSGWTYVRGRQAEPVRVAEARDEVRKAAIDRIAALNTLDPKQSDATLRKWLNASAGPLHDDLQRDATRNRQKIQQAHTGATGTVTDLAVTELDVRAGTARVIATVQVALGNGGPGRKRFTAVLTREGTEWKPTSLTAVPVSAA
jgi:Mce-associated membrane protein